LARLDALLALLALLAAKRQPLALPLHVPSLLHPGRYVSVACPLPDPREWMKRHHDASRLFGAMTQLQHPFACATAHLHILFAVQAAAEVQDYEADPL